MAIVSISRGTYSGARTIAEELASTLGIPCAGQEQIFAAAKEFGVPEAELHSAFIKPPRILQMTPGKRIAILNVIRAALLKLSNHGNLVYHGFAGHLLLADIKHILRVRVIASQEYRIEAAMRRHSEDREHALARIKLKDKQSLYWAKYLYGIDVSNPEHYDMILNLERIRIEDAVDTIATMSRQESFTPTVDSQQALEDLLLGSTVWSEIHLNPSTRSADVRVESNRGEIVITGHAGSEQMVHAIQDLANGVKGVREVACQVGIGSHWYW